MKVAIHQPNYLPYLGFFYKAFKSDVFVLLDNVQYSKGDWHNRNRIKTPQGEAFLTVPVHVKFGDRILDVTTQGKWKEKHLKTIEMNYKKAPHFEEVFKDLKELFFDEDATLVSINVLLILLFAYRMGFKTRFMLASGLRVSGSSDERLANICKLLHADTYLSGIDGHKYLNEEIFGDIKVEYSDYQPFVYTQQWGDEFIPNLSILDYVMNHGYVIPKEWL